MEAGSNRIDFLALLSSEPTRVKVSGVSMMPFIADGESVMVVAAARDDLREGDLVVFRRSEEVLVHRVVRIDGTRFYEMGDNQKAGAWVGFDRPLGKAVSLERKDGTVVDVGSPSLRRAVKRLMTVQRARQMEAASRECGRGPLRRFFSRGYLRLVEYLFKRSGFSF